MAVQSRWQEGRDRNSCWRGHRRVGLRYSRLLASEGTRATAPTAATATQTSSSTSTSTATAATATQTSSASSSSATATGKSRADDYLG